MVDLQVRIRYGLRQVIERENCSILTRALILRSGSLPHDSKMRCSLIDLYFVLYGRRQPTCLPTSEVSSLYKSQDGEVCVRSLRSNANEALNARNGNYVYFDFSRAHATIYPIRWTTRMRIVWRTV